MAKPITDRVKAALELNAVLNGTSHTLDGFAQRRAWSHRLSGLLSDMELPEREQYYAALMKGRAE